MGAQGNEAAQTGTKDIADLNHPNSSVSDLSSSGNNTATVEEKETETTTNSELEGVVRARGMSTPVKVILGVLIVLLLGGAGWFFFKRFAAEDDDDDDEDDDEEM